MGACNGISAGVGQKYFKKKGLKWETRGKEIKADARNRKSQSRHKKKNDSKKGIIIRPFGKVRNKYKTKR